MGRVLYQPRKHLAMPFRKWKADIIHVDGEGYRAIFSMDSGEEMDIAAACVPWRELCRLIDDYIGIRLPSKRCFKFEKLSDFEQIAGVDAATTRESCIVTMEDRRAGWVRWDVRWA